MLAQSVGAVSSEPDQPSPPEATQATGEQSAQNELLLSLARTEFSTDEIAPAAMSALEAHWAAIEKADSSIRPLLEEAGVFDSGIVDPTTVVAPITYLVTDLERVSHLLEHADYGVTFWLDEPERTESELIDQITELSLSYRRVFPDRPYSGLGLNLDEGTLRLEVPAKQFDEAWEFVNSESRSGQYANIEVAIEELPTEEGPCSNRDTCTGTFEAGMRIRKGSTTGPRCGLGLVVEKNGVDAQFLTAGHCGWTGSNSWYHQVYGNMGSEITTLYGAGSPFSADVMRVQMPDHKASNEIYSLNEVNYARNTYSNEYVCISAARSATVSCRNVTQTYTTWYSDIGGFYVYGSRADTYYSQGGDSGSSVTAGTTSVGIHNAAGSRFARVGDVLNSWSGVTWDD
jgi:hypothetical protein